MASRTDSDALWRTYQWWIVGALVAVGAAVRLADIGALGFRWDEDLSSLAAKAIAEHGRPELPSGMIYLRGLAFLYLLAASGELFGFSEWALRLPAAVFGIGMIPLSFLFGKRLFGTGVGLILAALLTFSAWDIEFSRYARMYAPFEFFYLLTLLCIWRYRVEERSTAGGLLCIAVALLTVSLHDLGYTLALAFLVPPLLQGRSVLSEPKRLAFPAAAFSVVAAFFFLWQSVQGRFYNRAALRAAADQAREAGGPAQAAGAAEPAVSPSVQGLGADAGNVVLGFVQNVLERLHLPELPVFSALWDTLPVLGAGVMAGALAAAGVFCVKRGRALDIPSGLLLASIALCCGFQLFNLAVIAALVLAFVKRRGISALRSPDFVFASALIGISFIVWLGLTMRFDLLAGPDGSGSGLRGTVRQLLNYPSFFVFWGFPAEYPLMSIPALVGGLWAFDRAAREKPHAAALFLLAVFALPVVVNGLFETRYQNFRYNVPFGPLFFAFVALGIARWREVLAAWDEGRGRPRSIHLTPAAVTALLVAAVVALDMNPLRSWLVTQRAYANEGELYELFDLRSFRDYRSAASYIAEHADADDTIIAFDCREYFNYLGRLDYCIVSRTYRAGDDLIQTYVDDGARRDLYLATPMIMDSEELSRTMQKANGTTWLLASDSMLQTEGRVSKDLIRFLAESDDRVVHVASDGDTKVYRF